MALSLSDIRIEFGGTNPTSLSEYYAGGAYVPAGTIGTYGPIPSSGTISIRNFIGALNVAAPVNVTRPYVFGSSLTGETLTTTNGAWDNITGASLATASYQWKRGGSTNIGTNQNTYVLTTADLGYDVTCVVTYTNAAGFASATTTNGGYTVQLSTTGSLTIPAGITLFNISLKAQDGNPGGALTWYEQVGTPTNNYYGDDQYPFIYPPRAPTYYGDSYPGNPAGTVTQYVFNPNAGYTAWWIMTYGYYLGLQFPAPSGGAETNATLNQLSGPLVWVKAGTTGVSTYTSYTNITIDGTSQTFSFNIPGAVGAQAGGGIRYGFLR